MKRSALLFAASVSFSATLMVPGAVVAAPDYEKMAREAIEKSFSDKGIAKRERVNQDDLTKICSAAELKHTPVAGDMNRKLEAAQFATIKYPADGKFLGDWKAGEKLAQSGAGSTYSDKEGAPNGGNCYNCHQISKEEISHGTLGPSLYNYGKLRGNAESVLKYTWGKIYNAKAFNTCTNMPRFGHMGILTEAQIKDLMALLLDPESPVNK